MLNDLEITILATKAMRLNHLDAKDHLKDKGFKITTARYYQILGHLSAEARARAFEHAKGFLEYHIDIIDELYNIKKMMYENAEKEKDNLKNTLILAKIVETVIPYISAYTEATKDIIIEEVKKKIGEEEQSVSLSALGI